MAGRSFLPLLGTLNPNVVFLGISFAPNGNLAVDQTTIVGRGVESVTRAAQGEFDVKLQDVYPQLISATGNVQSNAASGLGVNFGAQTLTTATRTIRVRLIDGATGAATDLAANANNRVNILLELSNTGL